MIHLISKRGRILYLLVFIVLFSSLAIAHRDFYFTTPLAEYGDDAINSLQIANAKRVEEIHGHYSRWGFHHPGPAYFYLYALGETVLYEWLHVVPSAYNAHLLTGLLLQSIIFTITLALVSRMASGRLFIPIVLLLAALHFGAAGRTFTSIWPPYTLLFPFLGFLVGCALVAMGSGQILPWVVLMGCMLVHNHVAQPLFVIPLFLWSYGSLVWSLYREGHDHSLTAGVRAFPRSHLFAAAIAALFLLPIIIDLLHGSNSNLLQILIHLQRTGGERKTLYQSVLYFLSFLFYESSPEIYLDKIGSTSLTFIWQKPWLLWAWITILITLGVYWTGRAKREKPQSSELLFVKQLTLAWLMAIGLSLVWGILITGPMTSFNGHFYYAIAFVPFMLAAMMIAHMLERHVPTAYVTVPLTIASLGLFYIVFSKQPIYHGTWNVQPLRQLLAAEDDAPDEVYLVFRRGDWPLAAGVALELRRQGINFLVAPQWQFMFGEEHTLTDQDDYRENMSIWRLLPASMLPLESKLITEDVGVLQVDKRLASLSPEGDIIAFGDDGNSQYYEGVGWGGIEAQFVWSAARITTILFSPGPADRDVCLMIDGFPYLADGMLAAQRVEIEFNGAPLDTITWDRDETQSVRVPSQLWNSTGEAELRFTFPQAVSPFALGASAGRRVLGVAFRELRTTSCE